MTNARKETGRKEELWGEVTMAAGQTTPRPGDGRRGDDPAPGS